MFHQLNHKFRLVLIRFMDVFRLFPVRLIRLFQHIQKGLLAWGSFPILNSKKSLLLFHWSLEAIILVLDCCGISDIYEILTEIIKFNTRSLTSKEKELAQSVFGDNIDYQRIRIDSKAFVGPKQRHICYVSFHTINCWGKMNDSILIHELVHVWQYKKMGAVYILRALRAQYTPLGYNYGGVEALKKALAEGKGLLSFNLEQQADIVSDYYRIRESFVPKWGNAKQLDFWIYEQFVSELGNSNGANFLKEKHT